MNNDREHAFIASIESNLAKSFSHTSSIESFINKNTHPSFKRKTTPLDLGCGREPKNPFRANVIRGIDCQEFPDSSIMKCDIVEQNLPFESNTFDYCTAYDLIRTYTQNLLALWPEETFIYQVNARNT